MTKISQPIWPSSLQVPRTPRPGMESADSRRLATKHSRKALKASLTLGILLGMFFVTWLPFFVANIAQVKKNDMPHCARGREEDGACVVPVSECPFHPCWGR